jgi:nicotinamidase-related amidase
MSEPIEPLYAYRDAMHAFTLDPRTSALVVIDLQYGSAGPDHGYAKAFRAVGHGELQQQYLTRVREVVVPSVRHLLDAFHASGAPVIFLTVGTIVGDMSDMPPRFRRGADHWRKIGVEPPYARVGTREMDVLDEIAPQPGDQWIVKTGASGFTASPLDLVLRNRGVREIAFCGVATAYCVESTLRDAADRGYDVVLVEDGCADMLPETHQRGVKGCAAFGRVASAAQVVAELTSVRARELARA